MIVIGLMCGTSLDGIDAARVDVRPNGAGYTAELQAFTTVPLAPALRERLIAAMPPARIDALELSALHADTGTAFGAAAFEVNSGGRVQLAGSHGITLAHDGDAPHTLQIGDPFRIRERIGVTVVSDFRAADTAAGGAGAPLVPLVDALLLGDEREDRVALNLGGIANLTVLRAGVAPGDVIAFDSGPANMPIDAEVRRRTGAAYDAGGALALRGRVDSALLAQMLDDPYLHRRAPKSTGRERYGAAFSARWASALDALTVEDAVATLVALTASSVAGAIAAHAPRAATVIVGGGGARNPALMAALAERLPGHAVVSSDRYGIDADAKEAVAFAVLAVETLRGRAGNVPSVTGARGERVLGSIAPQGLDEVLAAVRREEAE